jgi:hypothetical protein
VWFASCLRSSAFLEIVAIQIKTLPGFASNRTGEPDDGGKYQAAAKAHTLLIHPAPREIDPAVRVDILLRDTHPGAMLLGRPPAKPILGVAPHPPILGW